LFYFPAKKKNRAKKKNMAPKVSFALPEEEGYHSEQPAPFTLHGSEGFNSRMDAILGALESHKRPFEVEPQGFFLFLFFFFSFIIFLFSFLLFHLLPFYFIHLLKTIFHHIFRPFRSQETRLSCTSREMDKI